MEQLGASMETKFRNLFTKWGNCKSEQSVRILDSMVFLIDVSFRSSSVCARYPITIIVLGLAVAGALSIGIVYVEVTTDPVEIWASPESRSRQEKTHFDNSFTPFYRTAQVILHAEGLEPVSLFHSFMLGKLC